MHRSGLHSRGLALLCALGLLALVSCQGSNSSFSNPAPRSRAAAGTNEELPGAGDTSNRAPLDSSGGELSYRQCKLTVPVGALPETIFLEIELPSEAPTDTLPESAYQLSPEGLQLQKEALLTISYYDEDIPEGRTELDLVIVHQVSGVWVELTNSQVHVHNNVVQAPINFLGLYGLRARSLDSRTMNAVPVAKFVFSEEPFPGMESKPFAEAKQEMQERQDKAEQGPDLDKGEEGEAPPPAVPGEEIAPGPGESEQQGRGAPAQGVITERRVVGGPEKPNAAQTPGPGKPPAAKKKAKAKDSADSDSKAGNVAEKAPKKKAKPQEKKPAQSEAGDEEPAGEGEAGNAEAGKDAKIPGTTIYFDASLSSDPDGKIVQYDWDFDADGVFDYTSHASPFAKHTFYNNGDYTVVLKVSDNGRYAQAGYGSNVIRVRNPQAQPHEFAAHITAYPPSGPCPLTVYYAATAIGGTAPYVYSWTFPDGSQSKLANPFTTYPSMGLLQVSFAVSDIMGAKLTGKVAVESCASDSPATPQPRMLVYVSPPGMRGQAPFTAKFSLSCERGTAPVTYHITFGDETPGADPLATTENSIEHVYTNTGFYLVKIVATDALLRTASTFATVHAYTPEMARDFTASAEGVGSDVYSFGHSMRIGFDYAETSPRMVRFSARNVPGAEADLVAYQWDFGDGTFATEPKPAHTFAKDGVYEVRLTTSGEVQRWRHRIWLPVSAKQPAVAIQRPPYVEGPAPLRLNFDAIVTRGEEPLKYEWRIGEARRTDPSTFFVFQLPGDYDIGLEVRDRYDQPLTAPRVQVRVRSGGADYRMPLSVIEPVSGSTRVALIDYNSAYPLPMSSPQVEGPALLTDLSADGQRVAIVSDDGLIVKDAASAQPILAFLPAAGKITAVAALERNAAYCTVQSSAGPLTYLLRPGKDPVCIGHGTLLDASGEGTAVLLKPNLEEKAAAVSLLSVDVGAGQAGEPQPFGKCFDAALSRDGKYAVLIADDYRVVRRNLATGKDEQLGKSGDAKSRLVVSADARAIAFVSTLGEKQDIIYGRYDDEGVFRLASLTDATKFFSKQLRLSADGRYLLAYGCREDVLALLKASKGQTVADDELNGEAAGQPAAKGKRPPAGTKRYGVLRFDLSASPDTWSMARVNPRFIVESTAQFDYAGPFE